MNESATTNKTLKGLCHEVPDLFITFESTQHYTDWRFRKIRKNSITKILNKNQMSKRNLKNIYCKNVE